MNEFTWTVEQRTAGIAGKMRRAAPPDLVAFCKTEHPRLVGMLALYCGSREVAEELTQDVLVRVCSQWSKVRRMSSPQAWAYRVGTNLAHSYFRRKAAERRAIHRLASQVPATPESSLLSCGEGDDLVRALNRLSRRQRTALILRYFLDLSIRETAEILDCPDGTVKTLTRRGLRALSDAVEPKEASDAE